MHLQRLKATTNRAATLVAMNAPARDVPCFRMAAGAVPQLFVYDMIGAYEGDAAEFVQAVEAIDAPRIEVRVNSPGGLVWDAVAMYEALSRHPAAVDVHVDGLAGSAASFLVQAGDTRAVSKGGRLMIHDAQGIGIGSPAEIREYADLLDAVSDDISGLYAARAGGKPAAWRAAMTATTWYSAQQAVGAGLADSVSGTTKTSRPDNRTRLIQARYRALTA